MRERLFTSYPLLTKLPHFTSSLHLLTSPPHFTSPHLLTSSPPHPTWQTECIGVIRIHPAPHHLQPSQSGTALDIDPLIFSLFIILFFYCKTIFFINSLFSVFDAHFINPINLYIEPSNTHRISGQLNVTKPT